MNWTDFRNHLFDLGCFGIHQVYAWRPGFDRNNFVRWTRKGYLVRLRKGLYTFPEYLDKPDYTFLSSRCGIRNLQEFKAAVAKSLQTVDLTQKQKDFEHLLFHRNNSSRILHFREFVESL
jgi:hypothetical protein